MKVFPLHIRFHHLGLFAAVLSLCVLVAACGQRHNAALVVTACTDQDGAPLDGAVTITVDGVSKNWEPGETVSFPFQVESDAKTVRVRARSQNDYAYASQPAFTLVPDERRTLELRFVRPYSITVQTFGVGDMPLADVGVYADAERVGETDEQGQLTWTVSHAIRAGEKIDVELRKGGEATTPGSVILRPNRFEYDIEGRLPLRGAPEATLATASEPALEDPATPGDAQDPPRPQTTPTDPPAQTVSTTPPDDRPARPESTADRPQMADADTDPTADESAPETPSPTNSEPATVSDASAASASEASTEPSAPPSVLQRGHRARQQGNLREAIARYEEVPLANREAYKRAQQHIGEIYFRDMQPPDYQQAIAAFQAILDADNSEYAAHNNLAAVYLEIDALDAAEQHLNRVLALKHRIPVAQRQQIEREARYRLGLIQFARFDKERVRDNKYERGLLAQSALQRFVDAVPSGSAPFAAKRQDARARITTIREWLEQNR